MTGTRTGTTKKTSKLENSSIARNLYNNDNSIKEFIKFHKPREIKKIKFIEKFFNFENKKVLESNCGSGILINYLRKMRRNKMVVQTNLNQKESL